MTERFRLLAIIVLITLITACSTPATVPVTSTSTPLPSATKESTSKNKPTETATQTATANPVPPDLANFSDILKVCPTYSAIKVDSGVTFGTLSDVANECYGKVSPEVSKEEGLLSHLKIIYKIFDGTTMPDRDAVINQEVEIYINPSTENRALLGIEVEPTPTPIHWTLQNAISQLPEVYTNSIDIEIIEQYTKLLMPLPEEAQRWITNMGWGLEDLYLSSNEVALLDLLSDKNVHTNMAILTSPGIIEGVTTADNSWILNYEFTNLGELLQQDIDQLISLGKLSTKGKEGINRLIVIAEDNYEIMKGMYLIANFGHPAQNMFRIEIPKYNTQLFALGKILEAGIPDDYELAAVSAGLVYGSLITIADEEVTELTISYAVEMIDFLAETDQIITDHGGNWQTRDDTLEQLITLVWGAPGNYMPLTPSSASSLGIPIEPNNSWRGFHFIFRNWRFEREHWDWSFVDIKNLQEIRGFVIDSGLLMNDRAKLADSIRRLRLDYLDYERDPHLVTIDDWEVSNSYIANMNYQWRNFQENRVFVGTSGDAYIDTYIKKSIGVAGFTPTFWIHTSGYFEENCGCWRASKDEFSSDGTERAYDSIDEWLGWNKVPWDNFRLDGHDNNYGRMFFLAPLPNDVWLSGIPAGYIYRVRD